MIVAVLIPSVVKLPMVAGCLSSKFLCQANPDLPRLKPEKFLKFLCLFLQEKLDPETPESALSLILSWMLDRLILLSVPQFPCRWGIKIVVPAPETRTEL